MSALRSSCACNSRSSSRQRSQNLGHLVNCRPVRRAFCTTAACGKSEPEHGLSRRAALLQPLLLQLTAAIAPAIAAETAVETEFKELEDKILAYKFQYPVATTDGGKLSMLTARYPEKYSSAAPLTPDARQRIVAELLDLKKFVSVTVTVGPVSGVLKDKDPTEWKPKDVAYTVLIDRSTSRLASGARVALSEVEEAHFEDRNGKPYWVYEHIAQGSPTALNRNKESYRHSLAATTIRPGLNGTPYLYTFNLAAPQELWPVLEPLAKTAVESFTLTETTNEYIPPDKDPWLFF